MMLNNKDISGHKYYAFISYRGADVKWAKWFVKKSDNYLLPTITPADVKAGGHEPNRLKAEDKYLYPVFRDRDNLRSGKLLDQILEAIDISRKIVVLCTPAAAKSGSWMDDELEHIIASGRISQIIPLVVEGHIYGIEEYEAAGRSIEDPFPDDCNPYVLRRYMMEHRDHAEAINYIEFVEQGIYNPNRAFIKCVSSIIEMPFEDLWNRFGKEQKRKKRMRRLYTMAAISIAIIVGIVTWVLNLPVDVTVRLNESSVHNDHLPPLHDAVVTVTLDNETKSDTIQSIDSPALFANIPHAAIGKEVRITVSAPDWLPTDTTVVLSKSLTINLVRDPQTYGDIHFRLWNPNTEQTYPGVTVTIAGHETTADAEGMIRYSMPPAEQDTLYNISCSMPSVESQLTMPHTESSIIIVQ